MMKRLLVAMLFAMLLLPVAHAETELRWIEGGDADRVHLRAVPSTAADSLGLYFMGTQVILLEEQGGWARVLVGAEEGWMVADYLSSGYIPQTGPWHVVDNPGSTWVNLRTAPSMDAPPAMTPQNGRQVRLLGETADGWSYVDCGGAKGYIMTRLLGESGEAATQSTTVLGLTADWWYIHEVIAPNGQRICFTGMEDWADVSFEDVNFDGIDDIVAVSVMGASNFFSEFFVYDTAAGEYVRAVTDSDEERLCNVQLHPESGLVVTYTNAGSAGLMHVWNIYRWEGTGLKLIRSAVSDEWSEEFFERSTWTSVIHGDILHMTVRDHTLGSYDDCIVWEVIMPKDDVDFESLYEQEMEALWQGIR